MNDQVVISIVTVVINAMENLDKTLKSIKMQTYDNIELVIIDGASTDGTTELIERNRDVVDKYVSEPDEGLYYAMNKGKAIANGDFALFMNAGDEFVDATALEDVASAIEHMDILYYGNTIMMFDGTFRIAPKRHHQSIFFPKSYYHSNDYNVSKYKVTAEGDFILRSLKFCEEQHIDVDIIFSRIDGLRVSMYKSVKGMSQMYKEVTSLMKEHKGNVPLSYKLSYPIKSLAKYLAFKIGGLPLVAKMLLRSYKVPDRTYK